MTPKQKRCLDFIKSYTKSNGYSPSYQEMADYLGLASKSVIFHIIKNLKEQGYIEDSNKRRSIKLLNSCKNCKRLQKQLDVAIKWLESISTLTCCFDEDLKEQIMMVYRWSNEALEEIEELEK